MSLSRDRGVGVADAEGSRDDGNVVGGLGVERLVVSGAEADGVVAVEGDEAENGGVVVVTDSIFDSNVPGVMSAAQVMLAVPWNEIPLVYGEAVVTLAVSFFLFLSFGGSLLFFCPSFSVPPFLVSLFSVSLFLGNKLYGMV